MVSSLETFCPYSFCLNTREGEYIPLQVLGLQEFPSASLSDPCNTDYQEKLFQNVKTISYLYVFLYIPLFFFHKKTFR